MYFPSNFTQSKELARFHARLGGQNLPDAILVLGLAF
jgi:hypothetical protein